MPLIESLIQEGWLKTPQIISAFRKIQRLDFLPDHLKELAELNEALPIGGGQTISQPLVVAFMLELLQPRLGDKILDIGSGSGWTTALLAEIVGPAGKVFGIELIPALMEFGKENVARYNFIEKGIVELVCADGSKGWPQYASRPEGVRPSRFVLSSLPKGSAEGLAEGFDKILASATAQFIPQAWKEQLKIGGRIVAPIGSSIWAVDKVAKKRFEETEYPGFAFVPLITNNK